MSNAKQGVSRREVLATAGTLSIAGTIGASLASSAHAAPVATDRTDRAQAVAARPLTAPGAQHLNALMERLAKAPRRRDFKTVPMILANRDQWDHEALTSVLAYQPVPKQAWDNTDIASPWLNLMRNSLNAQVWSFKHPDFLAVSATHGSAHLALYDQAIWDKYQLTRLAGGKFKTNTLIEEKKAASADPANFEDPAGAFSPADNSIPALIRRGVVFMSCHNAIWEEAAALIEAGVNPDNLTPGAVGTLPELQQAGFQYAK